MENLKLEQGLDLILKGLKGEVKVKKDKTPKIICSVDGELITFKNEKELKKFMWRERPEEVVKYRLEGEVVVPFELQVVTSKEKNND